MSPLDRVRDRVPIEGGHGTQSQTRESTVSGTQSDTVGHSRKSIRQELDQSFTEGIEAAREKLAAKAQRRGQFARNRKAGLRLRHANKWRRIND